MHALAIVAFLVPAIASASPEQTLADVQASYAKVDGMTGRFTQTVTNNTYGRTSNARGTLYLARPDLMRWDYADAKAKPDKSIIFDGTTLWVIEPKNLQVLQHGTTSATLPAAVAFLNGGDLTKDFDVSTPKPDTIKLVPKQTSAQVKELTFVIDAKTKRVLRSIVLDHNGDTNTFHFTLEARQPKKTLFQFSPKSVPTYKVVRI